MATRGRRLSVFSLLAQVSSVINLVLALNFFPLVPLLAWLNYGRAAWTTAWLPDWLMLLVLPGLYYVYWHFWFIVAGLALLLSTLWWRQTGAPRARLWTALNGAMIAMYLAARIIMAVQGIRPDIV
jgi:hypothetical protein